MKADRPPESNGHDLAGAALLIQSGEMDRASRICHENLARDPRQAGALHLLGLIAFARLRYPEALSHFARALSISPDRADFHNDMGLAWMAAGQYDSALASFRQALAIAPGLAPAHYNQGLTHKRNNNRNAAAQAFRVALNLDPNYAKAHFSLGDLLLSESDYEGAERHLRAAIEVDSDYVAAYNHLAICLSELNRIEEARGLLLQASRIDPHSAQTHCNLGNLARLAHAYDKAVQHYREAIRLQPEFIEAHFNLSLVLLQLEDFHAGWAEYEWRLRFFDKDSGYPHRHGLPLWEDQPLKGQSILVYDEQGFGDVFMFSRFLFLLKARGARVILETIPALLELFRPLPFIDEATLRDTDTPPSPPCDYCIPLLSLPGRFNTTRETIRFDAPYLFANAQRVRHWARRMADDGLKIGLVWHGSGVDRSRRCSLDKLKVLADVKGVRWYGLQKGVSEMSADNAEWMIQLGPDLNDFAETAAVIANLDLVISIDTAVAHLAGAMGRPVWVLLPFVSDWRWFMDDPTTPWYSSMRLYRQPSPQNWDAPIAAMVDDLNQWIAHRNDRVPDEPSKTLYASALELHRKKSFTKAEAAYLDVLALTPDHRAAPASLGLLYLETGRNEDAIQALSIALQRGPDDYASMNNLGLAYQRTHQPEQAISILLSAIGCNPDYVQAYYNIGNVFMDLCDLEAAIVWYARALQIQPEDASAHCEMGKLYLKKLDIVQARNYFQRSVDLAPDEVQARLSLATTALMQGDFVTGWHHYRWRFKDKRIREQTYPYRFSLPRWQGEPFPGKRLIVHSEQGFGDTIQFSRFLPFIKALGGLVTFQMQPQLLPLFQNFSGVDQLEVLNCAATEKTSADLYVPLMDVPGCIGVTLATIPASVPYLAPDRERLVLWRQRLGCDKLKIGLVWSGNPHHINDHNRTCDLRNILGIGRYDGVQYYSLQKEISARDREMIDDANDLIHLGEFLNDFGDTAAAIDCIDLVITVDTAVAHLAGAMGKPTWVLLPHLPDWRWMLGRADSPWYPTLRLFRQPKKGDWEGTIRLVRKTLQKELYGVGK